MIIDVNNGNKLQIPGIAQMAVVEIDDDQAKVAVSAGNLLAPPRLGMMISFLENTWLIFKITSRSRDVATFLCTAMPKAEVAG